MCLSLNAVSSECVQSACFLFVMCALHAYGPWVACVLNGICSVVSALFHVGMQWN